MRGAALAACLALAACGAAPEKSDWERAHESQLVPADTPLVYPPFPREADLIPFEAGAPRDVRFFIDARSIEIGAAAASRRAPGRAAPVTPASLRRASSTTRCRHIRHPSRCRSALASSFASSRPATIRSRVASSRQITCGAEGTC